MIGKKGRRLLGAGGQSAGAGALAAAGDGDAGGAGLVGRGSGPSRGRAEEPGANLGRRLQKWHDPDGELMCMMKLRQQGFIEMTPAPQ